MFGPITSSFVLVEYENLQNIVENSSGYDLVYLDRSSAIPLLARKKTNLVLVGANALKISGAHRVKTDLTVKIP